MRKRETTRGARYRALTLIWHTAEQCYVQPGEEIVLDHLDSGEIDWLVRAGIVERIDEEVDDGTDDWRNLVQEQ